MNIASTSQNQEELLKTVCDELYTHGGHDQAHEVGEHVEPCLPSSRAMEKTKQRRGRLGIAAAQRHRREKILVNRGISLRNEDRKGSHGVDIAGRATKNLRYSQRFAVSLREPVHFFEIFCLPSKKFWPSNDDKTKFHSDM